MNDRNEPDLSKLRDGPHPPDSLEDRTLEALRQRGVLQGDPTRTPRRRLGRWVAAAAAILIFVTGFATGRVALPTEPSADFVLLLRESIARPLDPDGAGSDALVEEYARWAREGRRAGFVVAGERLVDGIRRVGPDPSAAGSEMITGYFLIRAGAFEEALAVARDCPHAKHGGAIEVRRLGR